MVPEQLLAIVIYLLPLLLVWLPYAIVRRRRDERSRALLEQAQADGLLEPASLHPLIDKSLCLGCNTCVAACPEKDVLGLINGKAELLKPANCIGHGACKDSCPQDAITLVLGTETRGVDIPRLGADFQTNVPGIFVAGELGGMGLIRNAISQGCQVIDSVRSMPGIGNGAARELDVVIVGAGPAGFAASLAAMQHGLRYATIEQETLGGTVAHYPRGKIVMTAPVELPLFGKVALRETSKEALLQLWQRVESETGVEISYMERVTGIENVGTNGFVVTTSRRAYKTRAVVLAIGRRGTPRKLGVAGEEMSKVVYRLIDAEQYKGQRVLVVGGGDSALEAAVSLSEQPGTSVILSYRSDGFSRAKAKNRERVASAAREGRLRVVLTSNVIEVGEDSVVIECDARKERVKNDAIIVCAGGILPTGFLTEIGVEIETKYGTA